MLKLAQNKALEVFLSVAAQSDGSDTMFTKVVNVDIDGVLKPMMVVGTAFPSHGDGHFIAVLNPDKNLIGQVHPGCAYSESILKTIVSRRCDLMLNLWIDDYFKMRLVTTIDKYQSRH